MTHGWMQCPACQVLWESDHAGTNCWLCDKPGERAYRPQMTGGGTWIADRNDPIPEEPAA